jgi:hypothetical protein
MERSGTRGELFLQDLEGAGLRRAFALGFVEDLLAKAQVLGGGFDVFVGADVLEGAFEGHLERRVELNAFAVA